MWKKPGGPGALGYHEPFFGWDFWTMWYVACRFAQRAEFDRVQSRAQARPEQTARETVEFVGREWYGVK